MVLQKEITLLPFRRGYHLITGKIVENLPVLPEQGILHIFIKHTSAELTINENADPSVRADFENFMNKIIPENGSGYVHSEEGDDDMPAHLKASLICQSVTVPISGHRLNLGIWQGIYLCEFRNSGGKRQLVLTVYS